MANLTEQIRKVKALKDQLAALKAEIEYEETALAVMIGVPVDWTGSKTQHVANFKVMVRRNENTTIDANRLLKLAEDHALTEAVREDLFRWKPEINKRQWNKAKEDIKIILASAITQKPGRVYFTIEEE